ncbi:hypothetical protein GCM10009734_84000 [Nonomuraea bangladeshensis]
MYDFSASEKTVRAGPGLSRNLRRLRSDSSGSLVKNLRSLFAGVSVGSIPAWSKNEVVPVSPTLPPKTPRTATHEASDPNAALTGGTPDVRGKEAAKALA